MQEVFARAAVTVAMLTFVSCVDESSELSEETSNLGLPSPGPITPCPPTDGRIDDLVLTSAPPAFPGGPSGLLQRSSINYLAGGLLDLTLTVPKCTGTLHVLRDGAELPYFDPSLVDQPPASWEILSTTSLDSTRQTQVARLHIKNGGTGVTSQIQVVDGSALGGAQASRSFTLSLVNRVGSQTNLLTTSIDSASFRNLLVPAIFDLFGDDGELTVTLASGATKTLYNPSYAPSATFAADGVHFAWSVKVRVDWACDRIITFSGTFRFVVDATSGVVVEWDGGHPTASFAVGSDCIIGWGGPSATDISDAQTFFQQKFQDVVDDMVNTPLGGGSIATVLDITHATNEIQLVFDAITPPRVFVKVPYLTYNGVNITSPYANGMAINPNEDIMLFPRGTAVVCSDVPSPWMGQCFGQRIGPAGVPNRDTEPPMVDDTHPAGTLSGERAEAAGGMITFARNVATPIPGGRIGGLIARFSTAFGPWVQHDAGDMLGKPCKLRADSLLRAQHRLTLATNDVFSSFLWNNTASQSYEVGIAFLSSPTTLEHALLDMVPECP